MPRRLREARLHGRRGEGRIESRHGLFVFAGSEEDAAPFRQALSKRRRLTFRGHVMQRDGSYSIQDVVVRILVIARAETDYGYRFQCALSGPYRPAGSTGRAG